MTSRLILNIISRFLTLGGDEGIRPLWDESEITISLITNVRV